MEDGSSWKSKYESCNYSERLLDKISLLNKTSKNIVDVLEVKKAIYYAKKYHGDQKRKSGEPYYSHPIEVAYMVSDYIFKTDIIVASILHDIVEDTEVTVGMILDGFGWRIAEMVDRLTRDRPDGTKLSVDEILKNARKKNDDEVILIKLIDRLHNMQTIDCKTIEKINKTTNETLKYFITYAMHLNNIILEQSIISEVNKRQTSTKRTANWVIDEG